MLKYQVNEIAGHIGYQNVSHFISAFKKKFGMTPKKLMG
ncbi:MAG: helix-turn-helix transcriptional regulator [Saprospiraceae bacterium]|nr:helix-turn-helix transcriptional regulator [Saprospiraceae bacterium]